VADELIFSISKEVIELKQQRGWRQTSA